AVEASPFHARYALIGSRTSATPPSDRTSHSCCEKALQASRPLPRSQAALQARLGTSKAVDNDHHASQKTNWPSRVPACHSDFKYFDLDEINRTRIIPLIK